jgi:hypothetical protein
VSYVVEGDEGLEKYRGLKKLAYLRINKVNEKDW